MDPKEFHGLLVDIKAAFEASKTEAYFVKQELQKLNNKIEKANLETLSYRVDNNKEEINKVSSRISGAFTEIQKVEKSLNEKINLLENNQLVRNTAQDAEKKVIKELTTKEKVAWGGGLTALGAIVSWAVQKLEFVINLISPK